MWTTWGHLLEIQVHYENNGLCVLCVCLSVSVCLCVSVVWYGGVYMCICVLDVLCGDVGCEVCCDV